MVHDVPLLLQALTGQAVFTFAIAAMWPPASSLAVRWPALTASVLFFGFILSSVLLSKSFDSASLTLVVSLLIFLSVTCFVMITSQSVEDSTPEDKEHQQ